MSIQQPTPKHLISSLKKDRSINPSDWDSKMEYWSTRIQNGVPKRVQLDGTEIRDTCVIVNEEAPNAPPQFYRDWQKILQELIKRTQMLPLAEFERLYDPQKQESFGTWLLNRVGWLGVAEQSATDVSTMPESDALNQHYLNMPLIRDICIDWINHVYEQATIESDLVLPPAEIWEYFSKHAQFASAFKSHDDVRHLVNFMHHEGPATRVPLLHNKIALKFSTDSTSRANEKITESHRGVAQLKETFHSLRKQAHELEERIQQCTYNVRKNIQHQKKSKAKWEMGRKRMFENALERRHASMRNLEEILTSIQTAETDVQVMDALKSGTTSLRVLTADMGDVDAGLEEMAETLADYKDIQDVLDSHFMEDEHVDDEEILKDLEKLSMEEQEAEAKKAHASSGDVTHETTSPRPAATTSASPLIPLPDIAEISFSLKLLDDETARVEQEITSHGDAPPKYLRDFQKELSMAYKLAKLKLKKRKRSMSEELRHLREKQQEFEQKALDLESSEPHSAARYAHYADILQREGDEVLEKHPNLRKREEQESNKKQNQSETPHKSVFEENTETNAETASENPALESIAE